MGVARRRGAGYDGWGRGEMRGCDGVISWDGMFDYMDPCWCSSGEGSVASVSSTTVHEQQGA